MNRIDKLFQNKSKEILSVYFTAGYPHLDDTKNIIESLEKAGVDMVEVGIPFSDPMVDGTVIQKSNKTALDNGMNLKLLFRQIKEIRENTTMPLVLMGYLNPVYHYGMDKFCRSCHESGIDGVILPDMPLEIYQNDYKNMFLQNNLHQIFLVTPSTSQERLEKILPESSGFVYMVSSSSTTGNLKDIREHLSYTDTLRSIRPDLPVMVGFGINNRQKFLMVCEHAHGGIIGSAFINTLSNGGKINDAISSFIHSIKYEK